jgi:hypothetical protein
MDYSDLSDERKIELAIMFVAQSQPLPEALTTFLQEAGLYDMVTTPMVVENEEAVSTH